MTRTVLTLFLGALTVATGIYTAVLQSCNYERARELTDLQRSWENLEAINVQREARAAAHLGEPGLAADSYWEAAQ